MSGFLIYESTDLLIYEKETMGAHAQPIVILLADDDEEDRMLSSDALAESRVVNELRFVEDGEELLDYLYHRGKYANGETSPTPGLILLDLNMPGLDGRKTLEIIKRSPSLKKIPVVVLTTSDDERDIKACYELGANTYVQKPVDFDGLIAAVKRLKEYWFEIALLPKEPSHD